MRSAGLARAWSLFAALGGIAAGLLFLFGPVHGGCMVTASGSLRVTPEGTTVTTDPEREICETGTLLEMQSEVSPVLVIAVAVWSFAPTLAAIGIWSAPRPRIGPVFVGLALALTSMMSMGAGPVFIVAVALPLGVTTYLALKAGEGANGGAQPAAAGSTSDRPYDRVSMSSRLSEEDVERIARAVGRRVLRYLVLGLVIYLVITVGLPYILFASR